MANYKPDLEDSLQAAILPQAKEDDSNLSNLYLA